MSAAAELPPRRLITEPLLLEEALRDQYPHKQLHGIRAERAYLARQGNRKELMPDDESLLVSVVQDVNDVLIHETSLLGLGDQGNYFTRLFHNNFVNQKIRQSVAIVHDILDIDDQSSVVVPVYGAVPLARCLLADGVSYERIYPLEITGTVGAKAGKAQIIGELPQAVKDPQRRVILFDDIIDVGTTVAVLLEARERKRAEQTGMAVYKESQIDFLNELKVAKSGHTNGAIYHLFARICEEQNVIVVPVFIKNPDIIHALAHRCKELEQGNVKWKNLQQKVIDRYDLRERSVGDVWVLGAGLLDIAIKLDNVIKELPEHQQKDPRVLNWAGNRSGGLLLRIGASIPGLVYLSDDRRVRNLQITNITKCIADTLSRYLG